LKHQELLAQLFSVNYKTMDTICKHVKCQLKFNEIKKALTFQAQNAKEKENTFKKLTYEIKKHVVIIYDSVKIKCQTFMHIVDIHQCNINDV